MWRASIQEFPENILEAPEWFLQTDSLTIVSTSAKHIDEKKKIEEKLERAAEQCSLDNQMSIFDLFPDFWYAEKYSSTLCRAVFYFVQNHGFIVFSIILLIE